MKAYQKTWFWLIEQCKDPSSQSKEYINLYQYVISSYGQKNMESSSTASWHPSKQLQYAILKEFGQKEFEDKSWQNGNFFIRLRFSESLTNPSFSIRAKPDSVLHLGQVTCFYLDILKSKATMHLNAPWLHLNASCTLMACHMPGKPQSCWLSKQPWMCRYRFVP